jgi:hypothetical protein
MEQWLDEMGLEHREPPKAMQLRALVLAHPSEEVIEKWRIICAINRNKFRAESRAKLCVEQKNYNAASRSRGISKVAVHDADDDEPLEHVRHEKQLRAIAEWKVNRFVEQGPGYIFQVRRGARASLTAIAEDYSGRFVIPRSQNIEDQQALMGAHNQKIKKLDTLRRREHATKKPADAAAIANQCEEVESRQVSAEEAMQNQAQSVLDALQGVAGDEEEDDATSMDPVENPTVDIIMKPNNLLDLRVHLSNSQVRTLLGDKVGGSEVVFAATFLFSTEAACVNNDKWVGLTGGWKGRTIRFLRNSEGLVDSVFVDDLCFVKYYPRVGGVSTDPFKCSSCGNIRTANNTVYAATNGRELHRGMYFCAVCNEHKLHYSTSQTLHRRKPRWDPTISRLPVRTSILSEQPFREFKLKRYAGVD